MQSSLNLIVIWNSLGTASNPEKKILREVLKWPLSGFHWPRGVLQNSCVSPLLLLGSARRRVLDYLASQRSRLVTISYRDENENAQICWTEFENSKGGSRWPLASRLIKIREWQGSRFWSVSFPAGRLHHIVEDDDCSGFWWIYWHKKYRQHTEGKSDLHSKQS